MYIESTTNTRFQQNTPLFVQVQRYYTETSDSCFLNDQLTYTIDFKRLAPPGAATENWQTLEAMCVSDEEQRDVV